MKMQTTRKWRLRVFLSVENPSVAGFTLKIVSEHTQQVHTSHSRILAHSGLALLSHETRNAEGMVTFPFRFVPLLTPPRQSRRHICMDTDVTLFKANTEHTHARAFPSAFSAHYINHTADIPLRFPASTDWEHREVYDAAESTWYITTQSGRQVILPLRAVTDLTAPQITPQVSLAKFLLTYFYKHPFPIMTTY